MADLINLGNQLANDFPDKASGNFIASAFGKMVFSYRVRSKQTQKELAEFAGISTKTIHRIEGGSGGVSDETYAKVFKALKIQEKEIAEFFMERANNDPSTLIQTPK